MDWIELIAHCYRYNRVDAQAYAQANGVEYSTLLAMLRPINERVPGLVAFNEERPGHFVLSYDGLKEVEQPEYGSPFVEGNALEIGILNAIQQDDGVLDENTLRQKFNESIHNALSRLLLKEQIQIVERNRFQANLTDSRRFEITYDGEERLKR